MYRSEIKFIINKYQMEIIKNNMNGVLQRDTNSSGNGSYLIRSLYFVLLITGFGCLNMLFFLGFV